MLSQNERMADVLNRPGVYGIRTLEQALSFFTGFDAAAEMAYFRGFGNGWPATEARGRTSRGRTRRRRWSLRGR